MITDGKISGVKIKHLKSIPDERGRLMEIFRSDDTIFAKFGQVYLTTAYPGVVKGWHYHKVQADNMAVISGMMKMVLYDSRHDSATFRQIEVIYAGIHNSVLIHIPPYVYHGFKCVSENEAVVINVPTELYNPQHPDEFRLEPFTKEIPYDWARKDG